mmetsp:Transcript_18324/g.40482  ORF Transcript_18324/g.40482 Transcript_18324/m.40482 type:complete len:318 (-) Transcript_18324:895-1848(-)
MVGNMGEMPVKTVVYLGYKSASLSVRRRALHPVRVSHSRKRWGQGCVHRLDQQLNSGGSERSQQLLLLLESDPLRVALIDCAGNAIDQVGEGGFTILRRPHNTAQGLNLLGCEGCHHLAPPYMHILQGLHVLLHHLLEGPKHLKQGLVGGERGALLQGPLHRRKHRDGRLVNQPRLKGILLVLLLPVPGLPHRLVRRPRRGVHGVHQLVLLGLHPGSQVWLEAGGDDALETGERLRGGRGGGGVVAEGLGELEGEQAGGAGCALLVGAEVLELLLESDGHFVLELDGLAEDLHQLRRQIRVLLVVALTQHLHQMLPR